MTLYPQVQKRAQEEIDRLIGTDRVPTLADRAALPYIEALYKEVIRWNCVGPFGLPHVSTEADTIIVKTTRGEEEYTIPKGSMLLPNIWYFMRDPTRYRDPDTFEPQRFLGERPELDPATLAFGFGRRICPGRVLADATVWLVIAQTLAMFDVASKTRRKDVAQNEGVPGLVMHPLPFQEQLHVNLREGRSQLLEKLSSKETQDSEKVPDGKKDFEILRDLDLTFGDD